MDFTQTEEFEKDIARLDGRMRFRLRKALQKFDITLLVGKPLVHLKSVYSERIGNFRLIYRKEGSSVLLVCFKNREDVYEFVNTRL